MNNDRHFTGDYSNHLDSSGDHLTYAALSAYLNLADQLSEKERQFFKRHLDTCAACASRLQEVEEVEGGRIHVLTRVREWKALPIFRYSIAAAVVLTLGAAVTLYILRSPVQQEFASQPPSRPPAVAAHPIDPERFVSSPVLDAFIERTVRSAASGGFRTPHAGDTVHVPVHFMWHATKAPYSLTILDNKNREILTIRTSEVHAVVDTPLAPGLYYVKLVTGGSLAGVTKFIATTR